MKQTQNTVNMVQQVVDQQPEDAAPPKTLQDNWAPVKKKIQGSLRKCAYKRQNSILKIQVSAIWSSQVWVT